MAQQEIVEMANGAEWEWDPYDFIYKCLHINVEVIAPCCNGDDCGCRGQHEVGCPDCNSLYLTEEDIQSIVDMYGVKDDDERSDDE